MRSNHWKEKSARLEQAGRLKDKRLCVELKGAVSMADEFEYISHARLVYHEGYRYAYLGEVVQPVIYGVQGALRQYYGAKEGPPVPSTLDQIVAAVAG
jgi:hypothetical protein